MRKKKNLILVLQALLIIVASFYFYSYVQKEVNLVDVYQYSHDLKANDKVDYKVVQVPAVSVTENMVTKEKDLEGKYVNTKVYADTMVYKEQLSDKGKVDPFASMDLTKYRKISLPISYVTGFGGELKRGDKVDLVFSGAGKKSNGNVESEFQYAKVFLQDIPVYNVTTGEGFRYMDHSNLTVTQATDSGSKENGEAISAEASSEEMAVVTIAVTLEQAEEISARGNAGKLSLLARFDDSKSYQTLGYVLGDYDKVYSAPADAEKK